MSLLPYFQCVCRTTSTDTIFLVVERGPGVCQASGLRLGHVCARPGVRRPWVFRVLSPAIPPAIPSMASMPFHGTDLGLRTLTPTAASLHAHHDKKPNQS